MPAKTTADAILTAAAPFESLIAGGLDGARTWALTGADAWSRGLNRSGRAALAAQALTAQYADQMLKLNLSAVPRALPSASDASDWTRPMALGGQWAQIYVAYLRDCGQAVAKAFHDDHAA